MKKKYISPMSEITVILMENHLLEISVKGDAGVTNGGDATENSWGDSRYSGDWDD